MRCAAFLLAANVAQALGSETGTAQASADVQGPPRRTDGVPLEGGAEGDTEGLGVVAWQVALHLA